MFTVIKTGGKQYRVSKGDVVAVEKLPKKEGGVVSFDVLLYSDSSDVEVGTPLLKNVQVKGKVVEHGKGEKVIAFKHKKRKRYSKKKGHRQPYTKVEITEIKKGASSGKKKETSDKTTKTTKAAKK